MPDHAVEPLPPDRRDRADSSIAATFSSEATDRLRATPTVVMTAVDFGPFRLFPQQRILLRDGTPLRLGSRAREILVALVERAGEVVSKRELMARVWPGTVVEEGTVRVHIATLRKALGEGEDVRWYVENVTGRGYRFVAPVVRVKAKRSPDLVRTDASDSVRGSRNA